MFSKSDISLSKDFEMAKKPKKKPEKKLQKTTHKFDTASKKPSS